METPVALIIFNRPDAVRRVFAAIAAARPTRLFVIADGPRADHPDDVKRCDLARKIVANIDWPCQVETNFSEQNLGCRQRMISGLNWLFSIVEEAMIIEDDCLPDASFFPYCAELLERYRDDRQIGMISGYQNIEKAFPSEYSYFFSRTVRIWGWATWRRSWQQFDEDMRSWPEVKQAGLLGTIFPDKAIVDYWSRVFDSMHGGTGPNAWGYHWVYTCWMRNWMSIVPSKNLVENIGFGKDATHTSIVDPDLLIPTGSLSFPLLHPPAMIPRQSHDLYDYKYFLVPGIPRRIRRKWLTRVLPAIRQWRTGQEPA